MDRFTLKSSAALRSWVELKFLFLFNPSSRAWCFTGGLALSLIQNSVSPFMQSGMQSTDKTRTSFDEKLFETLSSKSWEQLISTSEKESWSFCKMTLLSPKNFAVSSSRSCNLWYNSTVWIDPAMLCSCIPSEPKLEILRASKYCSSRADDIFIARKENSVIGSQSLYSVTLLQRDNQWNLWQLITYNNLAQPIINNWPANHLSLQHTIRCCCNIPDYPFYFDLSVRTNAAYVCTYWTHILYVHFYIIDLYSMYVLFDTIMLGVSHQAK